MAAQMDNGINKERVLNDLLKIAKKNGMITSKDLESAITMLELDKNTFEAEVLQAEGKIKRVADRYALQDFEVKLTKRQNAIRDKLLQTYRKADLEVPGVDEIYPMFLPKEKEDCKQVLESLISSGQLVMLTPQLYYHQQTYRYDS